VSARSGVLLKKSAPWVSRDADFLSHSNQGSALQRSFPRMPQAAALHRRALVFTESTGWRFLMRALDSSTRARGDPSTGSNEVRFNHVCGFNDVTEASSSTWGSGFADVLAGGHMHQANSGRPVQQSESAEPERGKHTSQTGDCPKCSRRKISTVRGATEPTFAQQPAGNGGVG
jgi:hypothetical protein